MEYCNGGTLWDLINQRKNQKNGNKYFEEYEIREFFTSILKGMQYIRIFMKKQNKNVILLHRDLKPDNFFFKNTDNDDKILKIGDFGIAKTYSPAKKSLSSVQTYKHFQSPEVSQGGEITDKTDIWMLGISLYYMCFFDFPWDSEFPEYQIHRFQKNNLDGKNLNFEKKNRKISNEMKNLLNSMLKYKMQDRISFDDLFKHKFFEYKLRLDRYKMKKISIITENHEKFNRSSSVQAYEPKINQIWITYNSENIEPNELDKEFCLYLESLDPVPTQQRRNKGKVLKPVDENEERKLSLLTEESKSIVSANKKIKEEIKEEEEEEEEEEKKGIEEEIKEIDLEKKEKNSVFNKKRKNEEEDEESKSHDGENIPLYLNAVRRNDDLELKKIENKTIFLNYFDEFIENFRFPDSDNNDNSMNEIPDKNLFRLMIQKINIAILINCLKKFDDYREKSEIIKTWLNESIIKFNQIQEIVLQEIIDLQNRHSVHLFCGCSCCLDENKLFSSKISKDVNAILGVINPQINYGKKKYDFFNFFGELVKAILQKMRRYKNRNNIEIAIIENPKKSENLEVLERNIFCLINLEKVFNDMNENDVMQFDKKNCQKGEV